MDECIVKYSVTVTPTPLDPDLIIVENDPDVPEIEIKTGTNSIYYGGDEVDGSYNPGVYTVEVRVWGLDNLYTGEMKQLKITILDPCQIMTL